MSTTISIQQLLKVGSHYGHVTPKWHPKMKEFIHSSQSGIYILDLRKSLEKLKEAYEYATKIGSQGGKVLFIGTKPQAKEHIKNAAEATNGFYVNHRWLGGTLTNFATIRQSVSNMDHLQHLAGKDQTYEGYLKKEAVRMEKERVKLDTLLGGLKKMKKLPTCLFVVDTYREHISIKEAIKIGIPVVAICDTNSNVTRVNVPIPGNDDSAQSIELYMKVFVGGLLKGRDILEKKRAAPDPEKKSQSDDAAVVSKESETVATASSSEIQPESADNNVASEETVTVNASPESSSTEETTA